MFRSVLSLICTLALLFSVSTAMAQTQYPDGSGWTMFCSQPTATDNDVCGRTCDLYHDNPDYWAYTRHTSGGYTKCYIQPITNDPCEGNGTFNTETGICDGATPNCDGEDGSASGSVYDSTLESCSCPSGYTDYLDPQGGYSCVQETPECSVDSPQFTGSYFNNQPVCNWNEYCAEGESGGFVDTGSGSQWVCLPDPGCDGTYINGSCISDDSLTPNPEGEFTEKDTDGDGVPDSSDGDIDGDGIPNGSDDDIDGDGVPNIDDTTNEKESSASGGNSCDAAPSCSGDAIDCAILQQQWLTRCAQEEEGEFTDNGCAVDPQCEGDPLLCAALVYSWKDDCALEKAKQDAEGWFENNSYEEAEDLAARGGPFLDGGEIDLSDITDGVLSSRSTVASACPAPESIDAGPFGTYEFSYQPFCDLADMIYWVVMLSAYLTGTFIIFRTVTN